MANPVPVKTDKAQISSAENALAEEILSSLVQIIARGTAGVDPVGPSLVVDENDLTRTKPQIIDKKDLQLGLRHLSLALAKNLVAHKDVSETSTAGKIPRAKADGKLDRSFIPEYAFATRDYVDSRFLSGGGSGGTSGGGAPVDLTPYARKTDLTSLAKTTDLVPFARLVDLNAKATDTTVVHKTGDETIAGTKTFSSPVRVAAPVATTDAATKAYVDASVAAGLSPTGSAGTEGQSAAYSPYFYVNPYGQVTSHGERAIAISDAAVTGLQANLSGFTSDISTLQTGKVATTLQILNGNGITGGGDLSTNRTLGLTPSGSAGVFGSTSAIPQITTDAFGRIVAITTVAAAGGSGTMHPSTYAIPQSDQNSKLSASWIPIGGERTTVAAGDDGRFNVPLIGFESGSVLPALPTTAFIVAGTQIQLTNPSPVYGGFLFSGSANPLTGFNASEGFGGRHGGGFMYPGNRGLPGATSSVRATVALQRSGSVAFWYRIASESGYDFGNVYVDAAQVIGYSGIDTGWTEFVSEVLGSGSHTIDFVYTKDGSVDAYGDAMLIDDLTVQYPAQIKYDEVVGLSTELNAKLTHPQVMSRISFGGF